MSQGLLSVAFLYFVDHYYGSSNFFWIRLSGMRMLASLGGAVSTCGYKNLLFVLHIFVIRPKKLDWQIFVAEGTMHRYDRFEKGCPSARIFAVQKPGDGLLYYLLMRDVCKSGQKCIALEGPYETMISDSKPFRHRTGSGDSIIVSL